MSVLDVRNLRVRFDTSRGPVQAVENVSLRLEQGRMLALVGESGSGKSVSALALLSLVPRPPAVIETGEAWFGGRNLLTLSERELRAVRGAQIALVPQDPNTALHPLYTVGDQIVEALQLHRELSREEAREIAAKALHEVGVPAAQERLDAYPHELSGGLRQRVMIAMAIALEPQVLLADEPTTALDVTVQAQILELLEDLRRRRNLAILFITHDLGLVERYADEVCVMYAGSIVERGPTGEVFRAPAHPYTRGLLASASTLNDDLRVPLSSIPGLPPDPLALPPGCAFAPRCSFAVEACSRTRPPLLPPAGLRALRESGVEVDLAADRRAACFESERVLASARPVL
jgi:oligopeptide/dipeptide ABC transporter ATP-binding protein